MRLLIQAALRSSRHFVLAVLTIVSLLLLTFANQCEMCSIGLMANTGADFFALFSSDDAEQTKKVHLQEVVDRWDLIDRNHDGAITKKDASIYLSERDSGNLLGSVMHWVGSHFDRDQNFRLLIVILSCVALFKAVILFFSRYITQILSIRITRDLRQQFFEHIQSLPMSFYQEHNLGSLSSRAVADASQISSSLNSCLTNYFQTPFTILSTLSLCFWLSWKLSMIIFLGLPLIIFPVIFLTRRVKRITRQLQKNQ